MDKPKQKSVEEIQLEIRTFATQLAFRDPNKALFSFALPNDPNLADIREDLTPAKIFGQLGFFAVEYQNLDPELKKGLEKDGNFFGHLLMGKTGELKPDIKYFTNKKGHVTYVVHDNGNKTYSWSRIKGIDIGYEVQEMSNKSNINEVLAGFTFYEIGNLQNPKAFPAYTKNRKAPRLIEGIDIAEKTRKTVEETIIGLA